VSAASSSAPGSRLIVVHGNRPENLRDLLVGFMTEHPLPPLQPEIVLVQSNGIGQWLRLALAAPRRPGDGGAPGLGIAAGLEFVLPARFLWRAYRAVLGPQAVPERSPFDREALVWRLMRLLPELLGQPDFFPLRHFLDGDSDLRRRFQLAQRLADLFDQYQVYRADWLADWRDGRDILRDGRGHPAALPADQGWQPALWRALLADVDPQAAGSHRAAVHEAFLQRTQGRGDEPRPVGLPPRVWVFGISSLPEQTMQALAAVARWSEVILSVHNPCRHHWADIVEGRELLRAQRHRQNRRPGFPVPLADDMLHLHAHPLLAAWGRQGRDFIELLDRFDAQAGEAAAGRMPRWQGMRLDLFESPGDGTLLRQIQDDMLDLRPLAESTARWPDIDPGCDGSLRFHVAHSPLREVEILHDQLLDLFDRWPDLQPRDVIVMVPEIDAYAPLVDAVFGLHPRGDPRRIPFGLADRASRGIDPLARALEHLLALPHARSPVSEVLDLLEVPAVRARFGITADDVPTLARWIRQANIRWGLHGGQRAALGLGEADEQAPLHSWRFGLRRLLLGYASGEAPAWQGIEPCAEAGGLEAAALGPLARLVEALERTWDALRLPADVGSWCTRFEGLLGRWFLSADTDDALTLERLRTGLQTWLRDSEEAGLTDELPLSVAAEHWLAQLDTRGLGQRFLAGTVTFATLMPMRAIPFRVVCLLGMNDDAYPRPRAPADFDLIAGRYRPGDRSRREDDRYLFLEALLAARDRLHISWVGRSARDNRERPPSVLVGQLREHVAGGWRLAGALPHPAGRPHAGEQLLAALTQEHPLQPFNPRYFPANRDDPVWFSYAREWRPDDPGPEPGAAAPRAAAMPAAHGAQPALPALPERDEPLRLAELSEFLRDPVRSFYRHRLAVVLSDPDTTDDDDEPFVVAGLPGWVLSDELMRLQSQALRAGRDPDMARAAALQACARRGDLPAGGVGEIALDDLDTTLASLLAREREALACWPLAHPQATVRADNSDALPRVTLEDTLDDIRLSTDGRAGRIVLAISRLKPEKGSFRYDKLITPWIGHLAAQLAVGPTTTEVLWPDGSLRLPPLARECADQHLQRLLAAWRIGMQRPLPLAPRSACAWLHAPQRAPAEHDKARAAYEGKPGQRTDTLRGPAPELARSPGLRRSHPSYRQLVASGEFERHARELLGPLVQAVKEALDAGKAADAAAGKAGSKAEGRRDAGGTRGRV